MQDFNIFNLKKWDYADTVKEAYIGRGTYLGFQNLLQLKDGATGLSLKRIHWTENSGWFITGGNRPASPVVIWRILAGYLKKELAGDKRISFNWSPLAHRPQAMQLCKRYGR